MFGSKKNIILHAHIFKNGGTTIDWILHNNFGQQFIDDRNDQEMIENPDYLETLLQNNKRLKAISSHVMPTNIQSVGKKRALTLLMLRNPITRARSCYDFERKQEASTPGAIHAKKMTFAEYVEWRLKPEVGATIRNFHVHFICQHLLAKSVHPDESHLTKALEFIESTPLIGLVERFDDSLVVFKEALKQSFPRFNTRYEIQNTTSKTKRSTQERIMKIREELGENLYQQLLESNQLDMVLYENASTLFENRLKKCTIS